MPTVNFLDVRLRQAARAGMCAYTASVQTDQGTTPIVGVWTELFNPTTQIGGFVDYRANSQATWSAFFPDVGPMPRSML